MASVPYSRQVLRVLCAAPKTTSVSKNRYRENHLQEPQLPHQHLAVLSLHNLQKHFCPSFLPSCFPAALGHCPALLGSLEREGNPCTGLDFPYLHGMSSIPTLLILEPPQRAWGHRTQLHPCVSGELLPCSARSWCSSPPSGTPSTLSWARFIHLCLPLCGAPRVSGQLSYTRASLGSVPWPSPSLGKHKPHQSCPE